MGGMKEFFKELLIESFRAPQSAGRRLMALDPPMEARWLGLLLISVIALIVARGSVPFMGTEDLGPIFNQAREFSRYMATKPWIGLPVQLVALLAVTFAMFAIGRLFGGKGSFADALLLFVWIELIMVLLQGAQLLAMFTLPPLAALIGVASYGMFLWLMVHFIAALHGFTKPAFVLVGMIASFFALIMIASVLLMLFGVTVPVRGG
jgi:hypothetical protein